MRQRPLLKANAPIEERDTAIMAQESAQEAADARATAQAEAEVERERAEEGEATAVAAPSYSPN